MLRLEKVMRLAAAALTATIMGTAVNAAVCPETVTLTRTFTVTPSPACYAYGEGNISGSTSGAPNARDPILMGSSQGINTIVFESTPIPGLVLLDKSDGGGLISGVLTGNVTGAGGSGQITIGNLAAGYTNLVLALKSGSNLNPVWAAFLVAGPGVYNYVIAPSGGNSHTNLYGTAAIPLPAAAWLMLAGLGGLGLVARRRKSRAA